MPGREGSARDGEGVPGRGIHIGGMDTKQLWVLCVLLLDGETEMQTATWKARQKKWRLRRSRGGRFNR